MRYHHRAGQLQAAHLPDTVARPADTVARPTDPVKH